MSKTHPTMARLYEAAAIHHGIRTPSELARRLDTSPQRLKNWDGRGLSQMGANQVQATLGISATWILEARGPVMLSNAVARAPSVEWSDVQGFAQAVGLGTGPEASEYAETHRLKFRADSLARKRLNPERLAVMYGAGDSMLPRIRAGDAILFDTTDTQPRDGALFVISVPGAGGPEYQVKRCEVIGEMVTFRADNPAGDHNWNRPRLMHDRRAPIEIVGRVRWIGSWED